MLSTTFVSFRGALWIEEFHLCNREIFLLQYEALSQKIQVKKPPVGSIHGPGTLTSTSTTDLMPSIPNTTASAQVSAGVSVSVQLCPSRL